MTVTAAPEREHLAPPPAALSAGHDWTLFRANADLIALLLALAVAFGPVVRGAGGRDRGLLLLAVLSLVPVVCLGKLWRTGRVQLVVALAPGLAAVVVCLAAPTGWAGAADVARLFLAGLLWLAVRAVANTGERRTAVLVAVSIAGLYQFNQAYLPWWGNGAVSHAMTGSFYAANVFGGFMTGAGLAALALAVLANGRARLAGVVAAPLCLAAVFYSASRAAIVLVLVGTIVAASVAAARRAWRVLGRLLALVTAATGLTLVLGSSLLMAHPGTPVSGAADKAGSRALASSGGYRVDWWLAAIHVGAEHPVTGAGFGSFATAESRYQRPDDQRTPYAHNVLLQAWSDGGLILVLPMLAALAGMCWSLLRRVHRLDAAAWAGALGGGAMVLHALVDFDAQYPSALALLVVLTALGAAVPIPGARPRKPGRKVPAAVLLVLVAVATLSAARFDASDARIRRGEVSGGMWTGAAGPFRDARFDLLRLKQGQHDPALLARTERLQQDNAALTWDRSVALIAAGRATEGRRIADLAWAARGDNQPGQALGYLRVLLAAGDRTAATRLLLDAFRSAAARPGSGRQPVELLEAIQGLGRADLVNCLLPQVPSRLLAGVTVPRVSACRLTPEQLASGGAS